MAAAAVALVTALVVAVVIARDPDDSTASPAVPISGAGVSWGRYAYIVDALPGLLPPTPTRTGHQGLRCAAIIDGQGDTPADLDLLPEKVARVRCTGNGNPIRDVDVSCSTNRNPYVLINEPGYVVLGDQKWERATGRGRVTWSTVPGYTGDTGVLGISFDEPTRNFCMVVVIGMKTGQELYDRWWADAPF